jgi:uncharacterized membrane protein
MEAPSEAPTNQPQASLPNTPVTWPGAFGLYKYSRNAIRRNISTLLFLYAIDILISIGFGVALKGFGQIFADIVSIVITCALTITYLASIRGHVLSISEVLAKVTPTLFGRYLLATLLNLVIYTVSLLLFVVPFFFVLPRMILVPYFVIDQEMGPIEAVKSSWHATKGNVGKTWGIIGASFAMILLCLTIIGIPFAIYFVVMYSAAPALLYEYLHENQPLPTPEPPFPSVA